jgi:hypothetical protein
MAILRARMTIRMSHAIWAVVYRRSAALRIAGVCQSLGAVLEIIATRTEQPFGTMVDGHAPGAPHPQFTRRRTPAAQQLGFILFRASPKRSL